MIKNLRNRFIRIAMLSVTMVMLLLTAILNIATYVSTTNDLNKTLEVINFNDGSIIINDMTLPDNSSSNSAEKDGSSKTSPDYKPSEKPDSTSKNHKDGPISIETPYSTRFFILTYDKEGNLISSKLDNIAAVDSYNVDEYLQKAINHGEGYGYYSDYRYLVKSNDDGTYTAVFIDSYVQLRAFRSTLLWSFIADISCIALVYVLVVSLSRKAIDPVVSSIEKQKQFITDASHELKTPLTVISTSLSVLEMEVGQQKWIDKARLQIEKMGHLINSLVTLSRLDEENPNITKDEFDISASMEETVESFRDSAESQGLSLECSIQPNINYLGDESSIRQLTSILMENALKYSTGNSNIKYSLVKDHHSVIIKQSNASDPLTKEETDRLFDRFYRPDESRNSLTGGFGVGLSIARSIAEAHNGSIKAEYKDGIIEFTATLK